MEKMFTIDKPLELECKKTLYPPIYIAYETYGKLNTNKTNAILVCHALTGSACAYSDNTDKKGFWDTLIGPNKALDTNKYFIICSNVLGSCYGSSGPSSTNPKTNKPYALDFPFVTIKDMVEAQKLLIEHLGIEKLLCAIGGSMGGMQVLQWARNYPYMVKSVVAIATTYRHNAVQIAFNEVARQAVINDPEWNNGNYYSKSLPKYGLAVARMVGHITYLSKDSMQKKFGRNLVSDKVEFNFSVNFQVESYLRYKGEQFTQRFDANSFLYLTKAIDYFDLQQGYPTLEDAISCAKDVKFLIVSFSSDWLYPKEQSKRLVNALESIGANVSYRNINYEYGHDSFLLESAEQNFIIGNFLRFV
ncbi:Homoserine O-acetyltransferase [Desulfurella amilsii]|uniref:Homoserine O-acetyltransferase n=1 Tax=Desulfurella amilsii TaxID=1562698 RepID=A0A1X4XUA4_9BACT|nr:homoserine O-acetyltransferase [Desulfurella amilsii]OSS41114.1 Homoserine O-acetyltransferase [Desulfurella amilsii]